MKFVSTDSAPAARGHYSQAVVHEGVVYVAGQLPVVPGDPDRRLVTFDEQARRVIDNVFAILEAAGSGSGPQSCKYHRLHRRRPHWPAFNAIYGEKFGTHKPARTVVPVSALHYGYLVEMDAVAAVRAGGAGYTCRFPWKEAPMATMATMAETASVERIWLKSYPPGVPAEADIDAYANIGEILKATCDKFADHPGFTCMGSDPRLFGRSTACRAHFGAWLQNERGPQARGSRRAS